MKRWLILCFLLPQLGVFALEALAEEDLASMNQELGQRLIRDLEMIKAWDASADNRLPFSYNHLLQGGYWNMPSARMQEEGNFAMGISWVPPYRNYNLNFQFNSRLEFSGNYRIFEGIPDIDLSPSGFGDRSDKGMNLKFALLKPEESHYALPGIAVGFEDFLGSRLFESHYVVMTKIWPDYDVEASVGIATKRAEGLFGGMSWSPWRRSGRHFLKPLTLSAEYDSTSYDRKERHPDGRVQRSPFNYGVKYRLAEYWELSCSHIRGDAFAAALSTCYNFGQTSGFLPKIDDPLPYRAPVNTEPLGVVRGGTTLASDLLYPFKEQGFNLMKLLLVHEGPAHKHLWIHLENTKYRKGEEAHQRLASLLKSLIPSNVSRVTVVVETYGLASHQYEFRTEDLQKHLRKEISAYEMGVLSPLKTAAPHFGDDGELLYTKSKRAIGFQWKPRMRSIFGSAAGKFKYDLGVAAAIHGFLFNDLYYRCEAGYTLLRDLERTKDVDRINPSQIINVQSDYIRYRHETDFNVEQAYLQKHWSLGKGCYSRVAGGHFQVGYGGLGSEFLYFPTQQNWALGAEAAFIRKRDYKGLGFQKKVRKLTGFTPSYQDYAGRQYFLDFYCQLPVIDMSLKVSAGQFLAFDKGVRTEVTRHFSNGMRVSLWYTVTDAQDRLNGERYHDKGVAFSMPLDIFYQYRSREEWGYGMSAWLRDVGARSQTGKSLFALLKAERG